MNAKFCPFLTKSTDSPFTCSNQCALFYPSLNNASEGVCSLRMIANNSVLTPKKIETVANRLQKL